MHRYTFYPAAIGGFVTMRLSKNCPSVIHMATLLPVANKKTINSNAEHFAIISHSIVDLHSTCTDVLYDVRLVYGGTGLKSVSGK